MRKDDSFVIGQVGRLTVEKNIHSRAELERSLTDAGVTNFRFLTVGRRGPQFIVREGVTGFIASDSQRFVSSIRNLAHPDHLQAMQTSVRAQAMTAYWDAVFESVYSTYERHLRNCVATGKKLGMRPDTVLS